MGLLSWIAQNSVQIIFPIADSRSREAVLKVHTKGIKISDEVYWKGIASSVASLRELLTGLLAGETYRKLDGKSQSSYAKLTKKKQGDSK